MSRQRVVKNERRERQQLVDHRLARTTPLLKDWDDRGRDSAGEPVKSRAFCWPCMGTGAKCLCEGCDCCPRCTDKKPALEA